MRKSHELIGTLMPLHEQAQAFLDELKEQQAPSWEELTPSEGRQLFSSLTELFGSAPEVGSVDDRVISSGIPVRCYRPNNDGVLPAVLFMHGGGWVLGDLDTHDALCRRLTNEANVAVVSVGYRLSPETPFPGALHDCYAALRFVYDQAAELRIDRDRIIVAGDSAGGNLATATAALACESRGPTILHQILIYPVLDHRCDSESYALFSEEYGLTKAAMKWFWKQYLATDNDGEDSLASPLLANDLSKLPPAHVVTAEYDVLRDEAEQYVRRLKEAGVPVTHRRYDGMLHGFVHFSGVFDEGRQAVGDIVGVIRSVCETSSATQM